MSHYITFLFSFIFSMWSYYYNICNDDTVLILYSSYASRELTPLSFPASTVSWAGVDIRWASVGIWWARLGTCSCQQASKWASWPGQKNVCGKAIISEASYPRLLETQGFALSVHIMTCMIDRTDRALWPWHSGFCLVGSAASQLAL